MEEIWEGHYLNGKTSAQRKAMVNPEVDGLKIDLDNGDSLVWPYDEIRQAQGHYEGEPVRLERGEGITEVLIVGNTDFLTALRKQAGERAGRFHDPGFRRTRWWLTFYTAIATLAVCFIAYKWGIPVLAKSVAAHVPVKWEQGLGKTELEQLAPPGNRLHNPRLDIAIKRIMARLIRPVSHCPYQFQVIVCDMPIVNAFALPGGYIVVFRGLLEETRTPEELAGVLAHEMQHVLKRHTTQRIIQDTSTGLLLSAMAGDVTGSMAFGMKSARTLALLEYSRGEEEEADREGMKLILAAGIDPQGMIRFFETLKKYDKMPQFLKYASTHPATDDRIEKLKEIVSAQTSPTKKGTIGGKIVLAKAPVKKEKLIPEVAWPSLMKGLRYSK